MVATENWLGVLGERGDFLRGFRCQLSVRKPCLTLFLRLGMMIACAGFAGDVFLPVMLPVSPLRVVSSALSEATQTA